MIPWLLKSEVISIRVETSISKWAMDNICYIVWAWRTISLLPRSGTRPPDKGHGKYEQMWYVRAWLGRNRDHLHINLKPSYPLYIRHIRHQRIMQTWVRHHPLHSHTYLLARLQRIGRITCMFAPKHTISFQIYHATNCSHQPGHHYSVTHAKQ